MTHTPSPSAADPSREGARQDNGQFGTQPLAEVADIELVTATGFAGAVRHVNTRTGALGDKSLSLHDDSAEIERLDWEWNPGLNEDGKLRDVLSGLDAGNVPHLILTKTPSTGRFADTDSNDEIAVVAFESEEDLRRFADHNFGDNDGEFEWTGEIDTVDPTGDYDCMWHVSAEAVVPSAVTHANAWSVAEQVTATDLKPGQVVLFAGPDGQVLENTVVSEPQRSVGTLFGRESISVDMRLSSGEISHDGYPATRQFSVARVCDQHGGAWGNDETCQRCTNDDGTAKPPTS